MNERGFTRRTTDTYVHSPGNMVKRQKAATSGSLVWVAVVDGAALPEEFEKRANAERAVLEALRHA